MVAGARLIEVPMTSGDAGFDLEAILAAIDSKTRIVFLANPNNPTGTMVEAAAVGRFLALIPSHVVVVLDEAYYEFACTSRRCVELLTRTRWSVSVAAQAWWCCERFRKRTGSPDCAWDMAWVPQNCWHIARACATHILFRQWRKLLRWQQSTIATTFGAWWKTMRRSQRFSLRAFRRSAIEWFPPRRIFCSGDLGEDAAAFANRLQDEGLAVRPLGLWGAPNCIRVTIGTPEQNQFFLQAARRIGSSSSTAKNDHSEPIRN